MLSHDRMQLNHVARPSQDISTPPAGQLVELEILRGVTRRRLRPITVPAFLIGRAEDCDLVLEDSGFPDAFAYVLIRGKEILLRHLGFAPTLCVNGEPVTQVRLTGGDLIQAGRYEFRLHVKPCEAAPGDQERDAFSGKLRPETALAAARAETLAEALDLIRCIREEVLGERTTFRLFLGPEGHLANLAALPTLPVDSEAFSGRMAPPEARSA